MNDVYNPYEELQIFASSLKVEYVHRFRYYKEDRWSGQDNRGQDRTIIGNNRGQTTVI